MLSTHPPPTFLGSQSSSSQGKTAAAVLPLIVVIGAIVIWDKVERRQGEENGSACLLCHRPRPSTASTASTSSTSHVFHSAYVLPVPSLPAVYSHKENQTSAFVHGKSLVLSPLVQKIFASRYRVVKTNDDVLPTLAVRRAARFTKCKSRRDNNRVFITTRYPLIPPRSTLYKNSKVHPQILITPSHSI
ncbi:hypothetical protein F5887DRAFT_927272 [Amanita rubescens]|nr:hypothetical protein F5887DRAFT_927272 [Amanita rubescens]